MVEAVMLWNEPNNKSHWDFELDPEWRTYGEMVKLASAAVAAENPRLTKVLGGISPIDAGFIQNMRRQGVLVERLAEPWRGRFAQARTSYTTPSSSSLAPKRSACMWNMVR